MKQEDIFEQMAQITKAHAYDITVPQLIEENKRLKERVKYLEDLITEYTNKMTVRLSGGKVDEFLKNQLSETDKEIEAEFEAAKNHDPNDLKDIF